MGDLDATAAYAKVSGKADVSRLGVTGFCWGGRMVWMYTAHNPNVKAAVAWYLGSLAFYRRDYASAEKILREALEIEPDHAIVRLVLARVLMHSGRGSDAIADTEWCVRALPGMTGAELIHVVALANAGEREAAVGAMRAFDRGSEGRRYTSPVYRAMAHTALDEVDRAFEWLSRAAIERDYWLINIAIDPAFDRLRPRAEFSAILRTLGLPELQFTH
jgi:dienelactone hydrolase